MATPLPLAPTNFFVNIKGSSAILVWDKVIKNEARNYIDVVGYFVYRTANPNGIGWENPYGYVETDDPYADTDVFFMDFAVDGDYLYKVCATEDGITIGLCAEGHGIVGDGQINTPKVALWDVGGWDVSLWG